MTLDEDIVGAVQRWLEQFVVDMNLCPFARREMERDAVRYKVAHVTDPEQVLQCLGEELALLEDRPEVETTLIVLPRALQDFLTFNNFLDRCDQLLHRLDAEGVYQIASFHPQYQFADTASDDAENYSNRSPYPMLHILREASVERAIAGHPDIDAVPLRNIEMLRRLGTTRLAALWRSCLEG